MFALSFCVLLTSIWAVPAARWSAFCPARCQCNDAELTVNCADAGFEVVPLTLNPMVKQITIPRNIIANVDSAFGVYAHLEALDVSFNLVSKLGSRGLELRELRRLDLSHNSITIVERDAFEGLESLTHLTLKRNSISELPSNVFTPLHNLKVLDLSQNKISTIGAGSFHGLTSLERLVLRSNSLRHVPSDSFVYLPNLRSLDLGSNVLSMVDEAAFDHLKHLEELSMDQCALSVVHLEAFSGVAGLKKLYLQNNNLLVFPRAIASLSELDELNIGGNLIPKISVNDLRHLKKLKKLHLTRSENLERIEEDVFRHTPELEELWMEFNMQLEHLPASLLNHLRQLRKVSLRGNKLKYIHPALLPIEQLESFDVSGNPLVCNCSLSWLWQHMANRPHQYHNSSAVRCNGPSHLESDFLKSLSDGQLECRGESGRGILAVMLTSVFVFCLVGMILFLAWRRRITDARVGTIIKDLDSSPVNYASYDNHKYPYIIQPYTTLGRPISGQAFAPNAMLDPSSYTTLSPNALQSYLMSLNSVARPIVEPTSNRAYQTLSCNSRPNSGTSSSTSTTTDPGYETIDRQHQQQQQQAYQSLIYV
ncbi:insulin-like growth factor-binding protein complex acid labile subunit [Galendromus occidentalis]|uniref:Insulin-like growth factor-binding protein complex acid labile subunit n=1 Tax=Galendromus occidentalis TaxID=34638 RepID=A0AAJ7PA81_9ACAR|nr:insulin-like growth factor-binding protein complex acid labile subunit [Galendromus occidentalis]